MLASVKDFLEPLFESTVEVSPIISLLIFIVGLPGLLDKPLDGRRPQASPPAGRWQTPRLHAGPCTKCVETWPGVVVSY
jgi:hypothetical protein